MNRMILFSRISKCEIDSVDTVVADSLPLLTKMQNWICIHQETCCCRRFFFNWLQLQQMNVTAMLLRMSGGIKSSTFCKMISMLERNAVEISIEDTSSSIYAFNDTTDYSSIFFISNWFNLNWSRVSNKLREELHSQAFDGHQRYRLDRHREIRVTFNKNDNDWTT